MAEKFVYKVLGKKVGISLCVSALILNYFLFNFPTKGNFYFWFFFCFERVEGHFNTFMSKGVLVFHFLGGPLFNSLSLFWGNIFLLYTFL